MRKQTTTPNRPKRFADHAAKVWPRESIDRLKQIIGESKNDRRNGIKEG